MLAALMDAQRRRDPLTEEESDQIRTATEEPPKRILVIAGFATARLAAIEQLRSNPNLQEDKAAKIHDLLEDFASIVDELDDNLDMFDERNEDLRKPLKKVIETNTDWQLRLRTLKETSGADLKAYEFALQDANESVSDSASATRAMLDEQNVKFSKSKDKDKKEKPDQR
jgi:regulator of replication initiation timing